MSEKEILMKAIKTRKAQFSSLYSFGLVPVLPQKNSEGYEITREFLVKYNLVNDWANYRKISPKLIHDDVKYQETISEAEAKELGFLAQ